MLQETFFDLITLIIFGIPGFFLLWTYGFKAKNDFILVMYSIFWGTVLMLIFYYALPIKGIPVLIRNPYVGSLLVSVLAVGIGWSAKRVGPRLQSWWILHRR
jgi:hypothetical protein